MNIKSIIAILIFITFAKSQPCYYYDKHTNAFHQGFGKSGFVNSNPLPPLFNWQMVQTPVPFFISDIFFVDSLYGWTSTSNGWTLKTTNGGYNWITTNFNVGGCICGLSFINRDTGWICGGMGRIRKTISGGERWIVQDYYPYDAYYYTISFVNYYTGYAAGLKGSKGYVIKTMNSGQNWFQIYLSDSTNTDLYDQQWLNENTGWFCGNNMLLKTTDGGNNYLSYLPVTSNGYNAILGISFINDQTGWISGYNDDRKNIYKTTNGGVNWVFQNNPIAPYQFSQLDDIIFINENTGWASAYVGQIIATTNSGLNWFTDLSSQTWFYCFTKYNGSKVWCGAHYGQVWILNDTGTIGIHHISSLIAENYVLKQNYPNPFNEQTAIEFQIPEREFVSLILYDMTGREIEILTEGILDGGIYKINYEARTLSSGTYIYSLEASNFKESKKFVLIK